MIRVMKAVEFAAAHILSGHNGACARLHGHNYRVEVVVAQTCGGMTEETCPGQGMVIDFANLKKILDEVILERFDHQYLNDAMKQSHLPTLAPEPTVENVAKQILDGMTVVIEAEGMSIVIERVRVWESRDSWAEASNDDV